MLKGDEVGRVLVRDKAGMFEEATDVTRTDLVPRPIDSFSQRWCAVGFATADQLLDLAPCLLDRVEVWAVARLKVYLDTRFTQDLKRFKILMRFQVIPHDDASRFQCRLEDVGDVFDEVFAPNTSGDEPLADHATKAHRADQSVTLSAVLEPPHDPDASGSAPVGSGHVGAHERLVQEHHAAQLGEDELGQLLSPVTALALDFGSVDLGVVGDFFFRVMLKGLRMRLIWEGSMVMA